MPSSFLIGFGETNGTSIAFSKMMFYNNNNSLSIFKDNSTVNISNPSKTVDTVFKLVTNDLHKISAYMDNALKTTQSTNNSYSLHLRIDSFTATPTTLDYLKVKPL